MHYIYFKVNPLPHLTFTAINNRSTSSLYNIKKTPNERLVDFSGRKFRVLDGININAEYVVNDLILEVHILW